MLLAAHVLTGCGLAVGGTKEAPWLKLPDGVSFSMGVNNVDQVLDRKGLNTREKAY